MRILDKNVVTQTRGIFGKPEGGNEWRNIPEERGKQQVLSDAEILELSELVVKIEKHYGFPVDVEWAREKGKFYIVQSRPITTITNHSFEKLSVSTVMNSDIPDLAVYQKLFTLGGVPYLVNDILMQNYAPLDALFTFDGARWESYLTTTMVGKLGIEGLRFYADLEKVRAWIKDFEQYRDQSKAFYFSSLQLQKIPKDQVQIYFTHIAKLHSFYIKTEFFYTDNLFYSAEHDRRLKDTCEIVAHIKQTWRDYVTATYFGDGCYLSLLVTKLGKQFRQPISDLWHYSTEEILQLFSGRSVDSALIDSRRIGYVTMGHDYPKNVCIGTVARELLHQMQDKNISANSGPISGTVAFGGIVSGRVRVFYEGYGLKSIDRVLFEENFHEGDILVVDTTSPRMQKLATKAGAIISDQGGMLSHAAIVARELKKPCIIGTKIATQVLKDGDLVEVDANVGVVRVLERVGK